MLLLCGLLGTTPPTLEVKERGQGRMLNLPYQLILGGEV